jgi:hypothetical protein
MLNTSTADAAHDDATREPAALTGGCLCGAVRYRIDGPVRDAAYCHCSMCRKASGALAVAWFSVPLGRLRFERGKPALYRSSSHVERRFCERCGSQLTFHSVHEPNTIDISMGSLDWPEKVRPNRHIWASSRVDGILLDPDLPSYPQGTPADAR